MAVALGFFHSHERVRVAAPEHSGAPDLSPVIARFKSERD